MAMLNTYFCWISMEFSFIRLMLSYIMKKIKFCSLYLMFIVSQRGPQGEQSCHIRVLTPGAASQTTSEQPSHSLIRITVEQDQFLNVFIWSLLLSWLIWGWWESGCNESCWDIWLFIFFALSAFTLHQSSRLCRIALLKQTKGDMQRGEGRHHTIPQCYWMNCQSIPCFPQSLTWTSPPQRDDGASISQRK